MGMMMRALAMRMTMRLARDRLRQTLGELLHDRFDIAHVTLQVESGDCGADPCGTPSTPAAAGEAHSHAHGQGAHHHSH